jgi:hypothetical protein
VDRSPPTDMDGGPPFGVRFGLPQDLVCHRGGIPFAEAPGGGWHVKPCSPDELISLLTGPCARVEWVALDPRPGRSGAEAANVMPRENFVDYLLCPRAPLWPRGNEPEATGGDPHGRENDR